MVKFSKTDLGTPPHLRWSSFQQLVMEESCKGLHLTCNKVLGSTPDIYVCHHYNMWSILTLKINMNKWKSNQLFSTKYLISLHHICVYLLQRVMVQLPYQHHYQWNHFPHKMMNGPLNGISLVDHIL